MEPWEGLEQERAVILCTRWHELGVLGLRPVAGRAPLHPVGPVGGEIAAWEVRSSHFPTLGCGFPFAEWGHLWIT